MTDSLGLPRGVVAAWDDRSVTAPDVAGTGWSIDEYIVVADLYLRRQRSSNANDPEVLDLARLTGRTRGSISRRLGNFHGTTHPGAGLKPVTGEAHDVFIVMSGSKAERIRLTNEARARLEAGASPAAVALPAEAARIVLPERMITAESRAVTKAEIRTLVRSEAKLVAAYIDWYDPRRTKLRSYILPEGRRNLRADLFDAERNLLIEAKAEATRESIRYGIGQLLDYRRYISSSPGLALLLPADPAIPMASLLHELNIGRIWRDGETFKEAW